MYSCPGCGGQMTFDIPTQQLKCGRCDRTATVTEADDMEARQAGSSFAVDLLTCPNCGAEIRAMNAAAASFCSYCGSSVMLNKRETTLQPAKEIAPFRITREECFDKYRGLLKKSWCAEGRLKRQVTAESFRGIYVPFHTYNASVRGSATLKGTRTVGDTTYYYDTRVQLDHRYQGVLHDASREFPDTLSTRVSRLDRKEVRPFSPAYLSGFYADVPDTDQKDYLEYARAEAVRNGLNDVLADMNDGCTYSTLEAQKELLKVAEAEPTGVTMVPMWFMSIRSGKRVLYAVQNGVTGEMAADIPMDIPRFALFTLLLAVPLFFLLQATLTLRPEMAMVAAMLLALIAQAVVNRRLKAIWQREKDLGQAAVSFDMTEHLKAVNKLASRTKEGKKKKGSGRAAFMSVVSIIFAGACGLFLYADELLSALDNVLYWKIGAFVLTLIMGILLFYGRSDGKKLPAGSLVSAVAMVAGLLILIVNPFRSADEPVYLAAFGCMAGVVWEALDMLLLYNRECSSPLPQFESHQGGEDHA